MPRRLRMPAPVPTDSEIERVVGAIDPAQLDPTAPRHQAMPPEARPSPPSPPQQITAPFAMVDPARAALAELVRACPRDLHSLGGVDVGAYYAALGAAKAITG